MLRSKNSRDIFENSRVKRERKKSNIILQRTERKRTTDRPTEIIELHHIFSQKFKKPKKNRIPWDHPPFFILLMLLSYLTLFIYHLQPNSIYIKKTIYELLYSEYLLFSPCFLSFAGRKERKILRKEFGKKERDRSDDDEKLFLKIIKKKIV